jgi:hypothetical protein
LIKEGKAQLIENAQDVIEHFDNLFAASGYDALTPRKNRGSVALRR